MYAPTLYALRRLSLVALDLAVLPGLFALALRGVLVGGGVSIRWIPGGPAAEPAKMLYFILGLMAGSLYAIVMGPTTPVSHSRPCTWIPSTWGLCPGGGDSHWAGAAEAPHRPAGGPGKDRGQDPGEEEAQSGGSPKDLLDREAGESLLTLSCFVFFSRAQDSRSSSWAMDFFPKLTCWPWLTTRQGTLITLYWSRRAGKWFRS